MSPFMENSSKTGYLLMHNENAGALTRPPATCPLCQYSCPKVVKGCQDVILSYHDVTWRHTVTSRDVMMWRHMTSGVMTNWLNANSPIWNFGNHVFQPGNLDLWPMTLTFELIWDIIKINASIKFQVCMSNGSAVRALTNRQCTQTHWHTHRRDRFYTLDRLRWREWISSLQ